ncbi:MAG: dihydrofolate reductase [Betaproteobacteria bacterium]|nr:dihydrofolate reductase [Betaproteobacteria bacterium]
MDNTPAGAPAPSPPLAIIAAVAADRGIGYANHLPWRLPEDLRHFKALTLGHRVVMGRKTWESLGRPLPGRENVVVSRQAEYEAPGALVVPDLAAALALPGAVGEAFCIGGAELYRNALPWARRLYLTEIDQRFPADTYFPDFDRKLWRECSRQRYRLEGTSGFSYHFVVYERIDSRNHPGR